MASNRREIRLGIEKHDRISELQDSILSKILCKLPTKNAVGTSILSTRWKNLIDFKFTPVKIALDDTLFLNPNRGDNKNSNNAPCVSFMDFVDKLLNVTLSDDANSVEEMVLHCDKKYGEDKVVAWVSAARRLNVRRLNLKFSCCELTEAFYHSLSGCTSLQTLNLWVKDTLLLPDNFSLPSLKTLALSKVVFDYDEGGDPVKKLIQGCPALEYLSLYKCSFWYDFTIEYPLLKTLVIEGCWKHSLGSGLRLYTPNLESLMYDGFVADRYYGCDLKCLQTAQINICHSDALLEFLDVEEIDDEDILQMNNSIAMFVSRCSSTIRLFLSDCAIDALHRSTVQLPLFHNLTWLALGRLHWSILARLLQIAPNLEHLIIEEGFQENGEGFADFENLLPIGPECLVLLMKSIDIWVFEGDENEIKLVEYFLKNGEVLQKLILHCLPPNDLTLFTTLLMLPRQSRTCQIECRIKQQFCR